MCALSLSFWMQVAGIMALVVPEVVYAQTGIDTNPKVRFWVGIGLLTAGLLGRVIVQTGSIWREWARIIAVAVIILLISIAAAGAMGQAQPSPEREPLPRYTKAEFLAVAVPLIGKWEGLRLEAYRDIVGVWTVCYGETRGVRPGDRHTKSECDAMLASSILEFRDGWHGYLTDETLRTRLHAHRDAAFTSLAYNVGIAGAGKSTATRRLNAGHIAGACEALTWWNRAGQRVIRGLVNRRAEEQALCMIGVE